MKTSISARVDEALVAYLDNYQKEHDVKSRSEALEQATYGDAVLRDEDQAQRLDIRAVPTLIIRPGGMPIGEGYGLSGAEPYEIVAAALEQVRAAAE